MMTATMKCKGRGLSFKKRSRREGPVSIVLFARESGPQTSFAVPKVRR